MLRIKLVRSPIGYNWRIRRTIEALGLRKMHQVKEHEDTPVIRGMIHKVKEMLVVEVVEGQAPNKGPQSATAVGKAKRAGAAVVEAAPEAPAKSKASKADAEPASADAGDDKPAKKPRAKKSASEDAKE